MKAFRVFDVGKFVGEDLGHRLQKTHSILALIGLFLHTRVGSDRDLHLIAGKPLGLEGGGPGQIGG